MSTPKPFLAHPGEVWEWYSDPPMAFYIVSFERRSPRGQMFKGISLVNGMTESCFMSYDSLNGWNRIA